MIGRVSEYVMGSLPRLGCRFGWWWLVAFEFVVWESFGLRPHFASFGEAKTR